VGAQRGARSSGPRAAPTMENLYRRVRMSGIEARLASSPAWGPARALWLRLGRVRALQDGRRRVGLAEARRSLGQDEGELFGACSRLRGK
jgi:hypothetical protein